MTLTESTIPSLTLLHRGKVRETYAVGEDRLLLVATDRLSAFDVVFDQPIPDKGRLLTALSAYWFRQLAALGPTHFLSTDAEQLPPAAREYIAFLAAQSGVPVSYVGVGPGREQTLRLAA